MTLTETVVTLSVATIIMATGFGVAARVPTYRMNSAAMRMFGMLNQSRTKAMTTGRYAGIYMEQDPETGNTVFYRVVDGNNNGLRTREIEAGIDRKVEKSFCLETEFKGIHINWRGIGSPRIISFSPSFQSSTGSIWIETEDPALSRIRIKLYGLSTITRPVRVFPDGTEETL